MCHVFYVFVRIPFKCVISSWYHHIAVTDPRIWTKEDVTTFIQWAEIEFDLPRFDTELFQMNGKALCLLTKQDLGERCPGAGDLLYNVLQLLRRGGEMLTATSSGHLPSSPVASHFPFSPTWCLPAPSSPAVLSPAPSIDSQSESPRHMDYQQPPTTVGHHLTPSVSIFPTTPTVGAFSLRAYSIFTYGTLCLQNVSYVYFHSFRILKQRWHKLWRQQSIWFGSRRIIC